METATLVSTLSVTAPRTGLTSPSSPSSRRPQSWGELGASHHCWGLTFLLDMVGLGETGGLLGVTLRTSLGETKLG